ncbi:hypothetical protein ACFL7M_09890 [Thermodesulfobacteriota bacterium]
MSYFLEDNSGSGYDSISAIYDKSRQANTETVQKLVKLLMSQIHWNGHTTTLEMEIMNE